MKRFERGFTLMEMLVTMSILVLIMGSVFLLFGVASTGFTSISERQRGHNQMAAVRASIQSDFQMTHFFGISVNKQFPVSVNGIDRPRDSVSLVGVENRTDPGSYNQFGIPEWDHWIVYRVVQKKEGILVRHQATPSGGQNGRQLLRAPAGLPLWTNSGRLTNPAWSNLSPPRRLADFVRSMEVNLDQDSFAVSLQITIERPTEKNDPKPDIITANFYIKPHNTGPID